MLSQVLAALGDCTAPVPALWAPNPVMAGGSDFDVFDLGVPVNAVPLSTYVLCWAHDGDAAWVELDGDFVRRREEESQAESSYHGAVGPFPSTHFCVR